MQHIQVIAVGKLKERFWADACAEYLKRLGPFAQVNVTEVADVDPAKAGSEGKAIEAESDGILRTLKDSAYAILLDIGAKLMTSEAMAENLEALALDGTSDIAFIIGGSCGVDERVRQRANARWSLGRITLPHNLARVVLLEQIYRAFKIQRHEPYHK